MLTLLVPNEMKTASGIKARFKTAAGRMQIETAIRKVFDYAPPEKVLITMYGEKPEYEGKTLAEIGEMEGRSPAIGFVDMVCEDNPPMAVFFLQDMAVVKAITPRDFIITDPHRNSTGINHLLVNGTLAIENGQATGDRRGYALRRNS